MSKLLQKVYSPIDFNNQGHQLIDDLSKHIAQAAVSYRLITLALIKKGMKEKATGTAAIFYGLSLANHVKVFDDTLSSIQTANRSANAMISIIFYGNQTANRSTNCHG